MSTICWDFDGTLVYSNSLWSRSLHEALLAADPDTTITYQDIRTVTASPIFSWDHPDITYKGLSADGWWCRLNQYIKEGFCRLGASDDIARQAITRIRDIIRRPSNYELYPDTISTLRTLKERGHHHVLLSNNYPELREILDALTLTPLFDGIVISAAEGYEKPRKELFNIAKRRCPAQQYYMIGDNPTADIFGGRASGMTTVLVHRDSLGTADYQFHDLHSVLSVIR